MQITIRTLVDITETGVRRANEDKQGFNQQSNHNVCTNVVGLRFNPEPVSTSDEVVDVKDFGFGTNYTDKQRVWTYVVNNPYTNTITEESLREDFDLIPVITGLNETALINNNVFRTTSTTDNNITFKIE